MPLRATRVSGQPRGEAGSDGCSEGYTSPEPGELSLPLENQEAEGAVSRLELTPGTCGHLKPTLMFKTTKKKKKKSGKIRGKRRPGTQVWVFMTIISVYRSEIPDITAIN